MRKPAIFLASLLLTCAAASVGANEIWEAGVAAFTKKDYKTAEAQFKKLVDQNPEGASSLSIKIALGRAYFNVRRYGDVTKLLGTVDASALPGAQQAAFYQIRGQAKFKNGDQAGAAADFKQLARLKPQDAQAQYTYGTTALQAGQLDESIRALGKAVQLNPNDVDMKRAYAQVQIKKGRESRDKTTKKTAYLKASQLAADLVAKDPSYENQMLKISAELGAGDYTSAIKTGQTAAALPGATWLASFYLGQAYTSAGQFAQAEAPLNAAKAKTSDPNDLKKIWRQLGFSYEKQKKYADSIAAYQNAGDQTAVARVKKNEETERFNKQVEEENKTIKAMEEEAKKLEAELKALEQGGGG